MNKIILITFFNLLIISQLSAQSPALELWEIQGEGIFTPYLNQVVRSEKNIVTAVGDDFFFIQTPNYRDDDNDETSNGIIILTNSTPTVEIGNMVSIEGTVRESFQRTQIDEADGLTLTIDSAQVTLPTPRLLTENFPSEMISGIPDLEKVEGMLVQFPQAITTAATNQFGETSIKIGTTRSFREPGIIFPAPSNLPEWDGNLEVFDFDPDGVGLPDQNLLPARMNISATGVIDFAFGDYILKPTAYEVTGQVPLIAVDSPTPTQATIGSLNCLVLSDLESEYLVRRQKVAQYIVDLMQAPDILAVQEVRSLVVLQDLANLIEMNHPEIKYTPYLISNGSSGSFVINVGYLVKNTVTDVQVTQLGVDEQASFGGDLHYRPPLLLEGNFSSNPPQPIQVLNLHLKSLGGITGGNATEVRLRRHEQGISVAQMVEERINENLVVVGDFNAFQFSDGYVDIVNQIAGTPSLGAEYPVQNIVSIPLTNQSLTLPPDEQYSYVFQNHAQILDHCLTTDLQGITVDKMQYVRGNADFSDEYENALSPLYYTSDHDGFVVFMDVGSELSTSDFSPTGNVSRVEYPNPFTPNSTIRLISQKADNHQMRIINVEGKIIFEKKLENISVGENFITIPLQIPTGIYFLEIKNAESRFSGKIIFP